MAGITELGKENGENGRRGLILAVFIHVDLILLHTRVEAITTTKRTSIFQGTLIYLINVRMQSEKKGMSFSYCFCYYWC